MIWWLVGDAVFTYAGPVNSVMIVIALPLIKCGTFMNYNELVYVPGQTLHEMKPSIKGLNILIWIKNLGCLVRTQH